MSLSNKVIFYEEDIYEKELESNKHIFYILFVFGFIVETIGLFTLLILIIILGKLLLFSALISYLNIKHARVMLEIQRSRTRW